MFSKIIIIINYDAVLARKGKCGPALCWSNLHRTVDLSFYTSAVGKNFIIKPVR